MVTSDLLATALLFNVNYFWVKAQLSSAETFPLKVYLKINKFCPANESWKFLRNGKFVSSEGKCQENADHSQMLQYLTENFIHSRKMCSFGKWPLPLIVTVFRTHLIVLWRFLGMLGDRLLTGTLLRMCERVH